MMYILYSFIIIIIFASSTSAINQQYSSEFTNGFNKFDSLDTNEVPFHYFFTNSSIRLYQKLISPSKGNECIMHPHCSLYGRMAFKKYNPIKAFIMTSDRLHRCGHDLQNYDIVEVDSKYRFYDPLEINFSTESDNSEIIFADITIPDLKPSPDEKETIGHKEDLLYEFAFSLQSDGLFNDAIKEYKRFLSYYPKAELKQKACLNLFDCYYLKDDFIAALSWGGYLLENDDEIDKNDQLMYNMCLASLNLSNYPKARYYSNMISSTFNNYDQKAKMITGLSYVYQQNWVEAANEFNKVDSASPYHANALECSKLSWQGEKLSYKNPSLAGIMAIIPGLGYLYDGYPKTAFSSLLINSLFLWGTYAAFDDENYGLGAVLGIFSFGWYTGNIYGSIVSAKRMNLKIVNDHFMKFEIGFNFK